MKKISLGLTIALFGIFFIGFNSQKIQAVSDPLVRDAATVEERLIQYEEDVAGTPNLSRTTSEIMVSAQLNTIASIIGKSSENSSESTGAVPTLNRFIASMYENKPASTQTFLADLSQSAHIVPKAQAQGLGFAALDPILFVWKTFRNIAYFLFVLIFLLTGFMIMFRHKINGQVVVTVEQAIPNIVVALLFVTFSYAIGGLLIDAMYLVMYLIVGIFQQQSSLLNSNIFDLGAELVSTGFEGGNNAINDTISAILNSVNTGAVFEWVAGLTVGVIVAIAVLFGVFKLFFELVKSYVSIILNVCFAPLILMAGAIPGQNTFAPWFKNMVANLVVFPLVLIMLIIQKVIQNAGIGGVSGGFMPPFLLGQGVSAAMPSIVGIGILLTIPEIVKKVKDKMGASEGIAGELAGIAGGRVKDQLPLTLRAGGLIGGSTAGLGAGAMEWAADKRAMGDQAWSKLPDYLLGKDPNSKTGVRNLTKLGVGAAGRISREVGANQPNIENPIINVMDKVARAPQKEELTVQSVERLINQLAKKQEIEAKQAAMLPQNNEE